MDVASSSAECMCAIRGHTADISCRRPTRWHKLNCNNGADSGRESHMIAGVIAAVVDAIAAVGVCVCVCVCVLCQVAMAVLTRM
jgi:hypothetical protein